jgi:flagellar hook-basal body complex protein FliE
MIIGPINSVPVRELASDLKAGLDVANLGASGATAPLGVPSNQPLAAPETGAAFRTEFSNYLTKAVSEVEGKMRSAEAEKLKVLSGETNNLHQATIAASEAGVAFSLMIEVRNKLVESYQELMRMQV